MSTRAQSCSTPPPGPIQDRLMPKLQKRVSPSLGGKGSLDGGTRYESLPYNTNQPVLVAPVDEQPVVSGALTGTNFYASAPASTFSPVSPLLPPFSMAAMNPVREPQRPTSSRSSIDIRRLDGTPYGSEKPSKQIKVAKDMHEGAVPPAYGTSTIPSHEPSSDGHGCSKPSCTKCGKRKTVIAEPQTSPSRTVPHYSRPISQGSTLAGPSSMPVAGQPLKKCHKCGKHKKPILAPLPPQPVFNAQHRFSSQSTIVPSPARPQQPQLSLLAGDNLPQPPVPQFEVIPPSASTYRRIDSAQSNYTDHAPLVAKQEPNNSYQAFRPASLIRSLSRRSSNKSRSGPPTPGSDIGEQQNSGGFMGLLRNQSTKDYRKLTPTESNSRPHSPAFSYMETANDDAFEMRPMTGVNKELGSPTSERSLQSPTGEQQASRPAHYRSTSIQPEGDLMLAIPEQGGDNRPQLTRFKSLRSGVSRAASTVSRSGSLKRLGSIHQAFYRDDMSLDAHNDGERGTVAAF